AHVPPVARRRARARRARCDRRGLAAVRGERRTGARARRRARRDRRARAAARGARRSRADPCGRILSLRARRRRVRQPRAHAASASAGLLSRVHGAHAGLAHARRAAHRLRRIAEGAGSMLLHGRPLRDVQEDPRMKLPELRDYADAGMLEYHGHADAAAAHEAKLRYLDVDLSRADDRATLFRALAKGLALPDYFGNNFDALADV